MSVLDATNPYRPGAGLAPPVLAGRDALLEEFDTLLAEVPRTGEGQRPWAVAGARGVGKTVLLLEMLQRAHDAGWTTARLEAGPPDSLVESLTRALYIPLRQAAGRARPGSALRRVLAVFSALRVTVDSAGTLSFGVDVEPPAEDTGADLGTDLHHLLHALGEWARAEGTAVLLTIDELDAAPQAEIAALNRALHRLGQDDLPVPVHVVAAGQAALPGTLARATAYAERLWAFHHIGPLDDDAAAHALRAPAAHLRVSWEEGAVDLAVRSSWGVPFLLQSIGRFAWQLRTGAVITRDDAAAAVELALADARGLFAARWEQLTQAQQSFVGALADAGGEADLGDLAAALGRAPGRLGRVRSDLVARGVVEPAGRGRVRFPLPGFAEYVRAAR